jgi:hypothetical protein
MNIKRMVGVGVFVFLMFGYGVRSTYAFDFGGFFGHWFGDRGGGGSESLTVCVKNNGAMYVVGEGFRKADCKKNDRLISLDLQGPKGDKGSKGDKGEQGEPGPVGPAGIGGTGLQGLPGLSAFDLALGVGFTGNVNQWLASLIGPQGPKGDPGESGVDGYTPIRGVDYFDGGTGSMGPQGLKGDPGIKGDSSLVVVTDESPGDLCTFGGYRIKTGLDTNDNGILDDPIEVLSESYACNGGADGTTGPQGPAGPVGPIGPTGPQGTVGVNGVSGWEVVPGPVSVDDETDRTITASCSPGKKVVGGGFLTTERSSTSEIVVYSSYPSDQSTWSVSAKVDATTASDESFELEAYAICVSVL